TEYDAFVDSMRTANIETVIQRLMSIKLLCRKMRFEGCIQWMELTRRNEVSDGYSWNCRTSHCRFYNK
ncbi:hypothetical protein H311_00661, partial [Anncaliia algerae PRA109]